MRFLTDMPILCLYLYNMQFGSACTFCVIKHELFNIELYWHLNVCKQNLYLFFFYHTTCESTCDALTSSAANQGDNTVSVAQGGTATPGTTKQP